MKKLIVLFVSIVLSLSCFSGVVAFAQESEQTVVFDYTTVDKTITSVLHTGDDLCLPKITAKQGATDVTEQVAVSVYDGQNNKVNEEGSFIAENLSAGTYTVYYSVGEVKSTQFTVTVSDDSPSASLDEDKRPDEIAYRDVAFRVRAITVDEQSSVVIYMYDASGNEVCSEVQKASARQVSLSPSALGLNTVTYKITKEDKVVLYSFPVYVDIKDYNGDYFRYSFEGDDWLDAYNLAIWCSADNLADGLQAGVTKEESRSGGASVKFVSVNTEYCPTLVFALNFTNDKMMRKDDKTQYTIRFWVKLGDDIKYDEDKFMPIVDFHALAKRRAEDSHYGAYMWQFGNFMIKQPDEDGWALVEYDFTSYSDEYVFSKDWLGSAPDYTTYGGMQFVIVAKNYTGTIYIDDLQMFKKGVEVDDLLEEYPHEEGFIYNEDPVDDSDKKKGCGSNVYLNATGLLASCVTCFVAIRLLVKKQF